MLLYVCPNPQNVLPPRMNPKVNYGLWVIMMCQCRLISCNKPTTVVWDVDSGGACAYVVMLRKGVYGKSLYLLLTFSVNLKLL